MANNYIDHYTTVTSTPTTAQVSVNHSAMFDIYSNYGQIYGGPGQDFYTTKKQKKSFNAELQDEIDEWLNIFN